MSCKDDNKKWSREFSGTDENLFIRNLKDKGLDDIDIFNVIEVLSNICKHCYDAPHNCQCWNDE